MQSSFDRLVAFARAWRANLDNYVGHAVNVQRRDHARGSFVRNVKQVGLHDVEVGEDDVQGGVEHASDWVCFEIRPDQGEEVARYLLMPDIGGRRHVVLSVDQLVPLPVVGEEHEVVVGELHPRIEGFMASLPGIGSFYLWEQHSKCHRDARIRRHFPHWFGAP